MGSRLSDDRLSDLAGPGAVVAGGEEPLPARRAFRPSYFSASAGLLILLASLAEVGVRFFALWLHHGSRLELHHRAEWLQQSCATILRRLGISAEVSGPRPTQGLIVSNHLSYLDILAFAAALPGVFVAKREVSRWPGIGSLARCGGTIFIDRQSRSSTEAVAGQIAAVLRAGVPVLLFPEGTSTDGSEVLRFHPSLLGAAVQAEVSVTAAAIAWRLHGGEERNLCYYGKIRFVPHLLAMLGRRGISCAVEFDPESSFFQDRKVAAGELREKVIALRRRMTRGMRS